MKSIHRALANHRSPAVSPLQSSHWRDLWKLKLHDWLKLLLWKVAWDVLPTKQKVALHIGSQVQLDEELLCDLCEDHLNRCIIFCWLALSVVQCGVSPLGS